MISLNNETPEETFDEHMVVPNVYFQFNLDDELFSIQSEKESLTPTEQYLVSYFLIKYTIFNNSNRLESRYLSYFLAVFLFAYGQTIFRFNQLKSKLSRAWERLRRNLG
jgi:hypothetical protein